VDFEMPAPVDERHLIRAARGLFGTDQATLAEKVDFARKTVVKIETDECNRMDPLT
jgi:DNA-binding XRE family transcriptional regulator